LADIEWLGHSCFAVRGKTKTLVFDPFKGIGLPEPKAKADIVLCSHGHQDHNNTKPVSHEGSTIMEAFTGTRQIDDISIKGVLAYHDDSQGSKRGRNSIYAVHFEDVAFCHLGDLGHELTSSQVNEIGSVDVLFLPVGGFFTIGPKEARKVMESLNPKVAVPMHYRAPGMSIMFRALKKVEDFTRPEDNVRKLEGPTFTVTKAQLPEKRVIIVPRLR
jgi:L-ascorbate metabolism protein UlaG (beta-lactamase superfamily)